MPGPIIAIVPFSPGIPKALSGRDAARPVLARLLGIAERDIRYTEDQDGKPRLAGFEGADEIHIAISHSGGLLAVYAGPMPAGLDLEWMKPRRDLDSLCQTVFSPARSSWILSGGERRHERFYRAWTGLEAGIKLEGDSIWSFAKRVGGASAPRRYWVLDDTKAGYALCLCSTGASPEFRVYVDGLVIRRMRLLAKDAGSDGLR